MKRAVNIGRALRILLPSIRKLVRATNKHSDGGRKITPDEWDDILSTFLSDSAEALEDALTN